MTPSAINRPASSMCPKSDTSSSGLSPSSLMHGGGDLPGVTGRPGCLPGVQRPFQAGSRFSAKARVPSTMSSLP